MTDRIKRIKDALETASDEPTVVTFSDGEVVTLPSVRGLLEDALRAEADFDAYMAMMPGLLDGLGEE